MFQMCLREKINPPEGILLRSHRQAAVHSFLQRLLHLPRRSRFSKQHLRHVEKDVLIPKIMREKARERCSEQVQEFTKCCKDSGVLMVVKCQKENSALKECLTAYYNDPAFYEECKMEYLKEREEFRKTGIPSKRRLQKLPTSM
ncbi:COX assembly mitochondrial protein homolog isoform X1 [Vicugna pacos]|uniref:COX assembly mitochondrial protein n=1 Tax=Vicugna pacos TaxID=30538 RepID=A0ABM5BKS3_VICPA